MTDNPSTYLVNAPELSVYCIKEDTMVSVLKVNVKISI